MMGDMPEKVFSFVLTWKCIFLKVLYFHNLHSMSMHCMLLSLAKYFNLTVLHHVHINMQIE